MAILYTKKHALDIARAKHTEVIPVAGSPQNGVTYGFLRSDVGHMGMYVVEGESYRDACKRRSASVAAMVADLRELG